MKITRRRLLSSVPFCGAFAVASLVSRPSAPAPNQVRPHTVTTIPVMVRDMESGHSWVEPFTVTSQPDEPLCLSWWPMQESQIVPVALCMWGVWVSVTMTNHFSHLLPGDTLTLHFQPFCQEGRS